MNVFNRIVVILFILTLMIVIPLVLILPEQTEYVLRYGADMLQVNLEWLRSTPAATQMMIRLGLAVVAVFVFLIGLLFLILEFIRFQRKTAQLKDGSGELMMDGVGGHLSYYIDLLPDVLRVRPQVESKGRSVRIELYVETAPEVNVPAKTAEIRETTRRVVEEQLGLQINGEIKVLLKPVAYTRARREGKPSTARAVGPGPAELTQRATLESRLEDLPEASVRKETVEVKKPSGDVA
jgi:hypothetical protein